MLRSVLPSPAVLEIPYDAATASGSKRRWSVAFVGAVALHVALALGAYIRLTSLPDLPPAAPIEAIAVEFAVDPIAPPKPKDERPPGPEAKASPAAAAVSDAPKIKAREPDPRGVLPTAPQRPTPSQDEGAAKPSVRSEASAPPAVAAPPAPALAAPRTSAATDRNASVTWRGLLLGRLKAYRRYPRRAQSQGQEGVAQVAFTVDRRGMVLSARIARGSGYPLLDEEALATVRRASPMPPPPDDVPGDPVEVVVPVDFFVR